MEWIRDDADFKYIDKNNENNILVVNTDNLVDEFYKYSKQFLETGNIVIEYMLETNSNGIKDMWFLPLIYLYRQAIELILKANVFKYTANENEQKEYLKLVGHNLSYSLEVLQIKDGNLAEIQNADAINWVKNFLDDITDIDKESDVFRYPFSNSGKKYFEDTKRTNLKYIKVNFNTAYEVLKDLYKNVDISNVKYTAYNPKLFIDIGEYRHLSVVGWGNSFSKFDFYPYINGYTESASYIRKFIIKNNSEELFLPMCYLFRNAVELSLKRILIEDTGIEYDKVMKIVRRKKHSVLGLWNSIKSTIEECSPSKEDTTIEDAEKYIQILQNFDSSSSKFRYPVDKDMRFHFGESITLDIDNVAKCFNELLNFLDGVNSMLSELREWESEMNSYYDY